jgi:hypothetical protein
MRHLVFSFYVATLLLKFLSTAADFSFQFGLGKSLFVLGRRFRGRDRSSWGIACVPRIIHLRLAGFRKQGTARVQFESVNSSYPEFVVWHDDGS